MVDNSQGKGLSPGSSIPCAQKSPEQQASTGTSAHSNNLHNTLQQNIAKGQLPASNQQAFNQSPVAPKQQSLLLQPPAASPQLTCCPSAAGSATIYTANG